jgi:integrase
MPRIKFTDRSIQAIDPSSGGQVEYFDVEGRLPGFGLRVAASGRKSWILLYRFGGHPRRLTLGRYPVLGLADARGRAKEALAAVVGGEDPAGTKREARTAITFSDLTEEYIEHHAKPKKRSWRDDERMLQKHVPREWRHTKAADIKRRDVRALLDSLVGRAPILANRVLALLRKVYNFGLSRDLVEVNPCHGIERPAPEHQRDRVLTANEVRRLWRALDQEDVTTAALYRLHLLTAQRGGELRSMAWRDLDLDAGWWIIPAEQSKNKLAHRVPLSPLAVAILRDMNARAEGESPWIFVTPSHRGYRMTAHKSTRRVRTLSGVDFVPHDLRRTAASHMTSLGISRLVVAKILNHVERGVTAVYDRHSYDREKRIALEAWAAAIQELTSAAPSDGTQVGEPTVLH